MMMRCPVCQHNSHTRTSRYLTETAKEIYYQCRNIECSCTFKTIESLDKLITAPDISTSASGSRPPGYE